MRTGLGALGAGLGAAFLAGSDFGFLSALATTGGAAATGTLGADGLDFLAGAATGLAMDATGVGLGATAGLAGGAAGAGLATAFGGVLAAFVAGFDTTAVVFFTLGFTGAFAATAFLEVGVVGFEAFLGGFCAALLTGLDVLPGVFLGLALGAGLAALAGALLGFDFFTEVAVDALAFGFATRFLRSISLVFASDYPLNLDAVSRKTRAH